MSLRVVASLTSSELSADFVSVAGSIVLSQCKFFESWSSDIKKPVSAFSELSPPPLSLVCCSSFFLWRFLPWCLLLCFRWVLLPPNKTSVCSVPLPSLPIASPKYSKSFPCFLFFLFLRLLEKLIVLSFLNEFSVILNGSVVIGLLRINSLSLFSTAFAAFSICFKLFSLWWFIWANVCTKESSWFLIFSSVALSSSPKLFSIWLIIFISSGTTPSTLELSNDNDPRGLWWLLFMWLLIAFESSFWLSGWSLLSVSSKFNDFPGVKWATWLVSSIILLSSFSKLPIIVVSDFVVSGRFSFKKSILDFCGEAPSNSLFNI